MDFNLGKIAVLKQWHSSLCIDNTNGVQHAKMMEELMYLQSMFFILYRIYPSDLFLNKQIVFLAKYILQIINLLSVLKMDAPTLINLLNNEISPTPFQQLQAI